MPVSIPINRDIRLNSFCLPVSNKEIRRVLSRVQRDIADLCSVEILAPRRNAEFGFLGRYDQNKLSIILYAHLNRGGVYTLGRKCEVEWSSAKFKRRILEDTIFHEIGHHVGFTRYHDLSEEFADDYVRILRTRKPRTIQVRY